MLISVNDKDIWVCDFCLRDEPDNALQSKNSSAVICFSCLKNPMESGFISEPDPTAAASEAAAVGSGSLIKPDSIGFLRQEKQITALVCLDWSALSGSALRQKSHTHISLSLTEISIYAPSVSVG